MKKIIVSITSDISIDQRVLKMCNTLHNHNFEVIVVCRKKIIEKPNLPFQTLRLKLLFNKGPLFYFEYAIRLFFILFFKQFDIALSNDLDTLVPNFLVSKIKSKKLVFDSHELFSEVPELIESKTKKAIWKFLENSLINKVDVGITVSESIAKYYKQKYNIDYQVIKNYPNKTVLQKTINYPSFLKENESFIIYQGAVNVGRGLELMIDAMQYLEDIKLLIVGTGDIFKDLEKSVASKNLQSKVIFTGLLKPSELKEITPFAKIGFSLEEDLGLNYRFALPNKLFDYIQAEVPVIISNLPEMKKIVENYKVGKILVERDAENLANTVKKVLQSNYKNQLKIAKNELVWEKQEELILSLFN